MTERQEESITTDFFAMEFGQNKMHTGVPDRTLKSASSCWYRKAQHQPVTTRKTNKQRFSEQELEIFRRERRRLHQKRYRKKQKDHMLGLQDSVQYLRREIRSLERERETLIASMEPKPNPWSIVAETFHVMELGLQSPCNLVNASTLESSSAMRKSLSYLEKSCAIDVSMGDLRGLDEILQRVLCCSLWCGAPEIKLERIDELAPGVISATARASATVTWSTLHHILPSFETSCNESDDFPSLRLLGQRISFLCQLNFLLDEEDGRLARLESTADILQPLIHALGLPGACAIAKVASTRIMSNLATHVVFRR